MKLPARIEDTPRFQARLARLHRLVAVIGPPLEPVTADDYVFKASPYETPPVDDWDVLMGLPAGGVWRRRLSEYVAWI